MFEDEKTVTGEAINDEDVSEVVPHKTKGLSIAMPTSVLNCGIVGKLDRSLIIDH
jgi:hypothetical protein